MPVCAPVNTINNFVAIDSGRLINEVALAPVQRTPWLDTFPRGTFENNMGSSVRVSMQELAVSASSLVNPAFTADIAMCGVVPAPDRAGETEFNIAVATLRGRSNEFCIKLTKTAFLTAYAAQEKALQQIIIKLVNADSRAQATFNGGTKLTVNASQTFEGMFAGDVNSIGTAFPDGFAPNAQPSFLLLKRALNHMYTVLNVTPFETDENGEMFKFVGGIGIVDALRNETQLNGVTGLNANLRAALTGRYKQGEQLIKPFMYEGPYQQIGFGIDPQPMRAIPVSGGTGAVLSPNAAPFTTAWVPGFAPTDNAAGGVLAFVEPEVAVNVTSGVGARRNPAWVAADYEVCQLMADNSFKRLTPEAYTGEGKMKFAGLLGLERLEWTAFRDNDCNLFGDFGKWIYEISRAYQPMQPHAICSILFKRDRNANLGLVAV